MGTGQDWEKDANCRGLPGDWFVETRLMDEGNNDMRVRHGIAKKVCAVCVVKSECLEYAIEGKEDGIWGGTNRRQRVKIERKRREQEERVERQTEKMGMIVREMMPSE